MHSYEWGIKISDGLSTETGYYIFEVSKEWEMGLQMIYNVINVIVQKVLDKSHQ